MSAQVGTLKPSVNGWNAEYLDQQYQRWLADPGAVAADLHQQLAGMYGGRATLEAGPTGRGWRNQLSIPWQEAPA